MDPEKTPRQEPTGPATGGRKPPAAGGYRFAPTAKTDAAGDANAKPIEDEIDTLGDEHAQNAAHPTQGTADEDKRPTTAAFPKPDFSHMERPINRSRDARKRGLAAAADQPASAADIAPVSLGRASDPTKTPQPAEASSETQAKLATPLPVKLGFDVQSIDALSQRTPWDFVDREERLPCSFPGLLRILIPEKSFTPYTLAVRVVNISINGAMVEIHDKTKLPADIAMANRFFELKVAHGEIPAMRGIVVWSDLKRSNPMLGVSCFEQFAELEKVLRHENRRDANGALALMAPKLDPYPPKTAAAVLKLTGEAPMEAQEVIAKGDEKKFRAPVENGRFALEIELLPNRENHFSLRAQIGTTKSRAVPVRIYRDDQSDLFRCDTLIADRAMGGKTVTVNFAGNVREAELILFRMSQLLAIAERVTLSTILESQTGFDMQLFEALQHDGKMLAEKREAPPSKELEKDRADVSPATPSRSQDLLKLIDTELDA